MELSNDRLRVVDRMAHVQWQVGRVWVGWRRPRVRGVHRHGVPLTTTDTTMCVT